MSEDYSACRTCGEREVRGLEVFCKKYDMPLIIGQLNSWESDYYQLPQCDKESK